MEEIKVVTTLSTVKFLSFIITDCQYMYVRSSPSKFPAIIIIAADVQTATSETKGLCTLYLNKLYPIQKQFVWRNFRFIRMCSSY